MKIINPNDTTHTITLIPRFYDNSVIVELNIYQESTKVNESNNINVIVIDGIMSFSFDNTDYPNIDFTENETYQIVVESGGVYLYRGKILATSQTTQDYKLTDGLYTYN